MYVFTNTIDDGAKPRRHSIQGIYTQEEYLHVCKNLGVEEGEGVCSKEVYMYFWELTVCIILPLK